MSVFFFNGTQSEALKDTKDGPLKKTERTLRLRRKNTLAMTKTVEKHTQEHKYCREAYKSTCTFLLIDNYKEVNTH